MKRALSIGPALGRHSIDIIIILTMNVIVVAISKNHRERLLWGTKERREREKEGHRKAQVRAEEWAPYK